VTALFFVPVQDRKNKEKKNQIAVGVRFAFVGWHTHLRNHSGPMPLVKIGRQLADELRGLVDGVDRTESGKPSGRNTCSDGRSGLAVPGESTAPHNHLIFLIA
jgi:hypothetical protein